jgi:hypothetical protein
MGSMRRTCGVWCGVSGCGGSRSEGREGGRDGWVWGFGVWGSAIDVGFRGVGVSNRCINRLLNPTLFMSLGFRVSLTPHTVYVPKWGLMIC